MIGAFGSRLLVDAELRRAASRFFELLTTSGIEAAPIKGIAVSALLYEDPLARPFGDVDVLVAARDVTKILALAKRNDFRIVYDSKQLGCVNVVVPPGIPFDVRCSVGPPGFAAVSAAEVLKRSTVVVDSRVYGGAVRLLSQTDHLLLLLVDGVMDKLALKVDLRMEDLRRGLDRWLPSVDEFAQVTRRAGLATAAHLVLSWLARQTGDIKALHVAKALEPLPRLPAAVARWLGSGPFVRDPHGASARVGIRFVSDNALRGPATLLLGLLGVAHYWARNGRGSPWDGGLWPGPSPGSLT